MSRDDMKLSDDEIEALLKAPSDLDTSSQSLTAYESDALGEIGNITFGSAATSLSTLLSQRVEITTPSVTLRQTGHVPGEYGDARVLVKVEYTAGLEGENALIIQLSDARTIADLMLGGDGRNNQGELNELHLSAVGEAMNQMMGSAATAMSTMLSRTINISPPMVEVVEVGTDGIPEFGPSGWVVRVAFQLRIGTLIDSQIIQLVPIDFAKRLVAMLNGDHKETASSNVTETVSSSINTGSSSAVKTSMNPAVRGTVYSQSQVPLGRGAFPESHESTTQGPVSVPSSGVSRQSERKEPSQAEGDRAFPSPGSQQNPTVVQRPEFEDFADTVRPMTTTSGRNLNLLLDVSLNITVELGRTRKAIKDVLDLAPGAIVELDKLAGEPVDILVNNKRIAVGEVVVIDENFGVRVTDIVSQEDRVRHLR